MEYISGRLMRPFFLHYERERPHALPPIERSFLDAGHGAFGWSSSLFLEIRHDAQRILGNHEFLVGWNHDDFNRGIVTGNEALFAVVIAAVLLLVKDNAQRAADLRTRCVACGRSFRRRPR